MIIEVTASPQYWVHWPCLKRIFQGHLQCWAIWLLLKNFWKRTNCSPHRIGPVNAHGSWRPQIFLLWNFGKLTVTCLYAYLEYKLDVVCVNVSLVVFVFQISYCKKVEVVCLQVAVFICGWIFFLMLYLFLSKLVCIASFEAMCVLLANLRLSVCFYVFFTSSYTCLCLWMLWPRCVQGCLQYIRVTIIIWLQKGLRHDRELLIGMVSQ